MKRRLTKLVLFLLLGAVVNVAVAWGCAYWVDSSPSDMSPKYVTRRTPQGHVWFVGIESERGAERVLSTRLFDRGGPIIDDVDPSDLIPSWSTISRDFDFAEPKTWDQQMQDARGWPMLSMRCTFCCTGRTLIWVHECEVVGGRELPRRTSNGYDISTLRALPYIPIPLGFVLNTLFDAAILWSLAFGPFTARRVIRHKHGLCINCGYDLRGVEHEACPECGVVVS